MRKTPLETDVAYPKMQKAFPRRPLSSLTVAVLIFLGLGLLTGCGPNEGIRTYRVAKTDSNNSILPQASAGPAEEKRMLAAIIPRDQSYWAFYFQDDPAKVQEYENQFREMVQSFRMEGTSPKWTDADGWASARVGGIIYAEILNTNAGLRATVSRGSVLGDDWTETVKANVNRWRRRLSLNEQPWAEIESGLEEIESLAEDESKAYYVSLRGSAAGGGGMGPFQNMMNRAPPGSPASSAADSGATNFGSNANASPQSNKPSLKYTAPKSWKEQDVSKRQFRLAAFEVEGENETGEVTVIAASGDIITNLGIWFNQVQAEKSEATVNQVIDKAEEIEANDVGAKSYFIEGGPPTEANQSKRCIRVVEIPWAEQESLFIKLMGPEKLVQAEQENFIEFVESVSW
ncbi:MAG: hypothetical protein AAF483_09360 [Planctomycetota bacterium]